MQGKVKNKKQTTKKKKKTNNKKTTKDLFAKFDFNLQKCPNNYAIMLTIFIIIVYRIWCCLLSFFVVLLAPKHAKA